MKQRCFVHVGLLYRAFIYVIWRTTKESKSCATVMGGYNYNWPGQRVPVIYFILFFTFIHHEGNNQCNKITNTETKKCNDVGLSIHISYYTVPLLTENKKAGEFISMLTVAA